MNCNGNRRRFLSSLLAVAMMASLLVVPASAADASHTVNATLDGAQVYSEEYPANYNLQTVPLLDFGVGVDAAVTVSSGSFSATSNTRPISMTGTLPNGTAYRLTENSNRVLSLTTSNSQLKDDISVAATTTPHSYTISANSGPEGFKDNLGSTSNPTCTVSHDSQSVNGNESWTVTFTPNAGLTIKALNIRNSVGGKNIISASAGSATVAGTDIRIVRATDGSVTISTNHAAGDMFVTALTNEQPAQYSLSVTTDGNASSDISSINMDAGTTKNVTLSSHSGYLIDTITITDGGKTAALKPTDKSVSVNGHSYSVTRGIDGRVILAVPGISANVSISATASSNKAYLQINAGSGVSCNLSELSYLDKGSSYSVKLSPVGDTEILSVKIESPTDSVTITGESRFVLDGIYYNVDTRYDSGMTLQFDSLPGNLKITVNSKESHYTVSLKTDGGADYEGRESSIRVEAGSSTTVSFVPNGSYSIEDLLFSYNGNSYRISRGDSDIRINGTRCPIVWESNGRVSVTLYNVSSDITVKAETNNGDKDYVLTLKTDGGANFNGSSRVYVDRGDSKTITFTPIGNYKIEELSITRSGSTYHASRGDSYITINGTRHSLTWAANGNVSIALRDISADMTVMADTTYDGYNGTSYKITKNADSRSTITLSNHDANANANQSVTVTVTPDTGYYLKSVAIKLGSTTRTLHSTTNSFVYDNVTYRVSYLADGSFVIPFYRLPADLTVSSTTARGTDPNWDDVIISKPPANNNNQHVAYITGIGNGQFAPYQTTTRAEAVVMLTRAFYGYSEENAPSYGGSPYTDVPQNAWYANAINYAHQQGVLTGLHGTGYTFRPMEAITRAEYTELVCRFSGVIPGGNHGYSFNDVPTMHWANGAISYAAARGWVLGYGNGLFLPDSSISRAELVTLTNRVTGRVPDRGYINGNAGSMRTFFDVPMSMWAFYDIMEAANTHYCSGDNGTGYWG